MTATEFKRILHQLFGPRGWPKPLHQLLGLSLVEEGWDVSEAARSVGTTPSLLERLRIEPRPLFAVLGLEDGQVSESSHERAARKLPELLVGRAAELAFEQIYKAEMHTEELELQDTRESRTDTDYRVYNGSGRPIYRLNIKFHGAEFRRSYELVGIEPDDCFPLATYKIYSALQKQEQEALPYLFAIVGIRGLTAERVKEGVPPSLIEFLALLYDSKKATRKRDFEDRLVELMAAQQLPIFRRTLGELESADWQVLSARRADLLVREKLYDRIFALRVPRFAQAFRGAELNMHFSVTNDMVPLREFLQTLKLDGHPKVATMIERGLI